MYATTLIQRAMDNPEIDGLLLGKEVPGLEINGAAYNFGQKTQFLSEFFPAMAKNGMRAEVLRASSDQYMNVFWILKKGFWLCGVYLNHPERMATIVAMTHFPGHSFYGLDFIAEKLDLKEIDTKGLEGLLAERAADMLNTIPKQKHTGQKRILVLGDD